MIRIVFGLFRFVERTRHAGDESEVSSRPIFCSAPTGALLSAVERCTICGSSVEAAQLMRPESVEGTVDLAKALIAQGNFADAVKILHEAADSSTKNPEVSGLLAKVCTELEQQTGTTAAVDRVTSICKIKTNHDNFAANSSRTTC
jgi:hypothetical protein